VGTFKPGGEKSGFQRNEESERGQWTKNGGWGPKGGGGERGPKVGWRETSKHFTRLTLVHRGQGEIPFVNLVEVTCGDQGCRFSSGCSGGKINVGGLVVAAKKKKARNGALKMDGFAM